MRAPGARLVSFCRSSAERVLRRGAPAGTSEGGVGELGRISQLVKSKSRSLAGPVAVAKRMSRTKRSGSGDSEIRAGCRGLVPILPA